MDNTDIYIHHFSVMAPADTIERTMHFYRDILGMRPAIDRHSIYRVIGSMREKLPLFI